MKPAPFTYLDPPDLDGVLAALAEHGDDAAVISGGQSLVPLMNLRLARPEVVVDPRHVPGLGSIVVADGVVDVGALATASELLAHPTVAAAFPALTEAVACIGHSQIRNRGTVGGSIAHADPSAELPAVLVGVGGEVVLASLAGERRVTATEFFDGPFSTTRRADELVVAVRFPVPPGVAGWAEIARRPGDFALTGVFAAVDLDDDVVADVRVALSGVADRPVRARAAEAALAGRPLDDDAITACGRALGSELHPSDDAHASGPHRAALATTLARRLLTRLAADVGRPTDPNPRTSPTP